MRLRGGNGWRRLAPWGIVVVLAAATIVGIQALVVKPYGIPSESMEPTLEVGQGILVNRLAYRFGEPEVGDIAVFMPPRTADRGAESACWVRPQRGTACTTPAPQRGDEPFVKRIAAGPGDRVAIRNGRAIVNGEDIDDWFVTPCTAQVCKLPNEITVPDGHFFMLGDNRSHSDDSRLWGPVPREWLIGKAFFVYSPLGDFGRL